MKLPCRVINIYADAGFKGHWGGKASRHTARASDFGTQAFPEWDFRNPQASLPKEPAYLSLFEEIFHVLSEL
jgi:hypothetical protein